MRSERCLEPFYAPHGKIDGGGAGLPGGAAEIETDHFTQENQLLVRSHPSLSPIRRFTVPITILFLPGRATISADECGVLVN